MNEPVVPPEGSPRQAQAIGRFLFTVLWSVQVVGADRVPSDGPVVLAANHQQLVDGPILMTESPRPPHILIKKEMFAGPVGWALRRWGQIETDRHNGRQALAQGLGVLRRGGAVGIFPEGNRGSGTVDSARAGVAWLAVNGDAPVVPVAILNTRLPGESAGQLPRPRRHFYVEFGEPVQVTQPGVPRRQAIDEGTRTVRDAMVALIERASATSGYQPYRPASAAGPGPSDGPAAAGPSAETAE